MQYHISCVEGKRRVPKIVWSKGEPYTDENGEVVIKNATFIFTEDTPPNNLTEALAFVHKHADVLPTDTIQVSERTPWNYYNDQFRPAFVSVLVFDGNDVLLSDKTDEWNELDESEVVLWGDGILDALSDADLDYFHELLDAGHDVYVVGDAE